METDALDLDQVVDDEGELEPDGEPYYFNYGNIDKSGLAEGECYCNGCRVSVHGILQVRILERVIISFSRGSS